MPDDDRALAESIANESVPDIIEKADEVVTPPKQTEKVSPEDALVEPEQVSEEASKKAAEKELGQKGDEEKRGADVEEGDKDPFKGVDIKQLLKHPVVGPQLQQWSDRSVGPQVEQRLEAERGSIVASERRTAEERQEDEHFASLDKDALAEELSANPKTAAAYARYQARLQAPTAPINPTAIARTSEVYAVANQMRTNTQLVEGSELSSETKERLKAENFADQGRDGLLIWGQEIFKALVEHEAGKLTDKDLEEKWEAYKQEHLVDLDGDRPPTGPGRKTSPLPDLVTTPTPSLFEDAFEGRKPDKREGAK